MSRAFVKESDGDLPEDFPQRAVSEHPNFVTARGLRLIAAQVHELQESREAARQADDKSALARIDRDLRYWRQRRASARLVTPEASPGKARFGTRVQLQALDDDTVRVFTLVGEDEADPAAGRVSWISPIGQSLLGCEVGEEIALQGQRFEILAIDAS